MKNRFCVFIIVFVQYYFNQTGNGCLDFTIPMAFSLNTTVTAYYQDSYHTAPYTFCSKLIRKNFYGQRQKYCHEVSFFVLHNLILDKRIFHGLGVNWFNIK